MKKLWDKLSPEEQDEYRRQEPAAFETAREMRGDSVPGPFRERFPARGAIAGEIEGAVRAPLTGEEERKEEERREEEESVKKK